MRSSLLALVLACACTSGDADGDADKDTTPGETDDGPDSDADTDTDVPDPQGDPCLREPAIVTVGTGEVAYEPLADGADLTMVRGGQGGTLPWHVTVAFHAVNVPKIVRIHHVITDVASGHVIADWPEQRTALVAPDPREWRCEGELFGLVARLELSPLGADPTAADYLCDAWSLVAGRAARVDVTLTADGTDLEATGSREVVIRPDRCDADPTAAGCGCDPALPVEQRSPCCPT